MSKQLFPSLKNFHGIFTLEKDELFVNQKQFASPARHMSGQRWSSEDYTSNRTVVDVAKRLHKVNNNNELNSLTGLFIYKQ